MMWLNSTGNTKRTTCKSYLQHENELDANGAFGIEQIQVAVPGERFDRITGRCDRRGISLPETWRASAAGSCNEGRECTGGKQRVASRQTTQDRRCTDSPNELSIPLQAPTHVPPCPRPRPAMTAVRRLANGPCGRAGRRCGVARADAGRVSGVLEECRSLLADDRAGESVACVVCVYFRHVRNVTPGVSVISPVLRCRKSRTVQCRRPVYQPTGVA